MILDVGKINFKKHTFSLHPIPHLILCVKPYQRYHFLVKVLFSYFGFANPKLFVIRICNPPYSGLLFDD